MGKRQHILPMVLAMLITLLAPLIPHHHHDGGACFVVEHCEHDDVPNDDHTSHAGDDTLCIEGAEYLTAKSLTKQPTLQPELAIVSTVALLLMSDDDHRDAEEWCDPPCHYLAPELSEAQALRAPPTLLS